MIKYIIICQLLKLTLIIQNYLLILNPLKLLKANFNNIVYNIPSYLNVFNFKSNMFILKRSYILYTYLLNLNYFLSD